MIHIRVCQDIGQAGNPRLVDGGAGAAIANAVADALGDDRVLSRLPLTPDVLLAFAGGGPTNEE